MKKKAKRATSVQRIAREIYPEGTMTDAVAAIRLSRRIRRVVNAAVKDERERCVLILYRWHKSAQSARTPLGRDVCEHLEAIIKEVCNPKKYP
jgi:hypothetical protein